MEFRADAGLNAASAPNAGVDEYATHTRHPVCARFRLRHAADAPRDGPCGGFPPPDVIDSPFGGKRARGAKIRGLGIHDEQAF
ncbi:hypothetical protein [Burkholderia diffusa]|uniref:hypothetical protein n=1 Tax=Burkholderia diffusa TaxID=488732 RepID=UPI00075BF9CA|nr:hypothetical protein [Burkholderia diffusa]KVG35901.1 hypothetical protein WJ30_04535 [Burkholderia diffusa]